MLGSRFSVSALGIEKLGNRGREGKNGFIGDVMMDFCEKKGGWEGSVWWRWVGLWLRWGFGDLRDFGYLIYSVLLLVDIGGLWWIGSDILVIWWR